MTSRKKTAEKSEILTSTPNKELLLEKKRVETKKEAAKKARKKRKFYKFQQNTKKVRAKANKEKSEKNMKKIYVKSVNCLNANPGTSSKQNEENDTDNNVDCLVCGENYSENWIQCKACEGWSHELCADIDDTLYYYCDV